MSDPTMTRPEISEDQIKTALFAHLVMQQSNMAMMLLGKTPHPETGETIRDLETAKMFVELLEMLETKTKGNLTKEETMLLKNALMATRMAFVEAANAPASEPAAPLPAAAAPDAKPSASAPAGEAPAPAAEEEHKKKFTKKY